MSLPHELVEAVRARRLLLFAGAGLSVGLGLPTWGQLVDQMAEQLGYDPRVFRSLGDPLTLAEYYLLRKRSLGPLRSWMDTRWHGAGIDIGKSEVHRLVVEMGFPAIYTTNYDRWLERAHDHHGRPYTRVVNVTDMGTAAARSDVTAIVKFHGDFDDDSTLVLTESHFLHRLELDSPLDLRLRADLLGRSVLFVGYSLSDPNIRRLLFKLRMAWKAAGLETIQPRSFLFAARPNPVQEAVLDSWGVTTIGSEVDHPGDALEAFLRELVAIRPG